MRELHARGGMATVWVADDAVLSRRVAVKILHSALAADDVVRDRFRREAFAAAKVAHPNIVSIYDTGEEDDGTSYIVMELVEGRDLRRALEDSGPMAIDEAVEVASQIAEALDFAHRHGLVHRDVKPANVLLDERDHVKVADFGIAKALGGGGDLTRTGVIVGTARYLAPEQVTGGETDARADVYALALIAYEMLTGTPAFESDHDIGAAMARLSADPPSLADRRPDVPTRVSEAVERGMARDRDNRWATAGEFRDALHGRARPPSPHAPRPVEAEVVPAGRRRVPTVAFVTVAIAAVAIAVAGAWALWSANDDPGTPSTAPSATIAGAADFDPLGDGRESPSTVAGAIDGDPATGWRTETYTTPDFGRAKDGVGLQLDLGERRDVAAVEVATDLRGWSAEIFVADRAGSTLDEWGAARATGSDLGTTARLDLDDGSEGRFVLLWLTRLPPSGRLVVNEVRVAG